MSSLLRQKKARVIISDNKKIPIDKKLKMFIKQHYNSTGM
jgi:hypothetical protein